MPEDHPDDLFAEPTEEDHMQDERLALFGVPALDVSEAQMTKSLEAITEQEEAFREQQTLTTSRRVDRPAEAPDREQARTVAEKSRAAFPAYDDLFGAPALEEGRSRSTSESRGNGGARDAGGGGEAPPAYDDLFGPPNLPGKSGEEKPKKDTDEEIKRELDRFEKGKLPISEARGWIRHYEESIGSELPDAYKAKAPERHVQDEPEPPAGELNRLKESEEERVAREVREEMEGMAPLERLEHAAHVQEHRSFEFWESNEVGDLRRDIAYPISEERIREIQREAVQHILSDAEGSDPPAKRLARLDRVVLKLDLMDDFSGIIHDVAEKAKRIRQYLEGQIELRREHPTLRSAKADQATKKGTDLEDEAVGTPARRQHLNRAILILAKHPELKTKGDFQEAALQMASEVGMSDSKDPGNTIWISVHRLAKDDVLEVDFLPEHYSGLDGFRQLVQDLLADAASIEPKEKQQNRPKQR